MNKVLKSNNSFEEKVLKTVFNISKGKVLSYKKVAELSGNKNLARKVGSILSKNQNKKIPCHRVVHNNGKVGKYNGLLNKKPNSFGKISLLKKEGVKIKNENTVFFP